MTLEERNKLVNEIQTRSTKITNEAQKIKNGADPEPELMNIWRLAGSIMYVVSTAFEKEE